MGHRVTGDRRGPTYAGWEVLYIAIDDHARVALKEMHPDETGRSSEQFLLNAVAYFNSLGILSRAILTDNGSPFVAKAFL